MDGQTEAGGGERKNGGDAHGRPFVREVIVVEGKDDVAAVKRACRAQTLTTSGLGISREIIEEIRIARLRCGVIILTDPDFPGEKIRHQINQAVPGCKNAYLHRARREKTGPVGVEYAGPAEILAALSAAKATVETVAEGPPVFSLTDLIELGLSGGKNAKEKRDRLSGRLGIGCTNAGQFLRRLNAYGISRRDFLEAYQASEAYRTAESDG